MKEKKNNSWFKVWNQNSIDSFKTLCDDSFLYFLVFGNIRKYREKKTLYITFLFVCSIKYYYFLKKNIMMFISHRLYVLEFQFL